MDADLLSAIQIIALHEAENDTYEFFYNRICRWYSKEFSTSLVEVEDMPEEKIFKTYFEDMIARMREDISDEGKERYERYRTTLINPELVEKSSEDDDKWVKEMNDQIKNDQISSSAAEPNLIDKDHQNIFIPGEEVPDFFED